MASLLATTAVTTAAPFLQNIKIAAQQLKPLIKEFKETVEMTTDEIKDVVVTVKEAEQDITNAVTSVDNQGKLYELQTNLELEEAKKDILETDYSNPITPDYSIPVNPDYSNPVNPITPITPITSDYSNPITPVNPTSNLTSIGKDYLDKSVPKRISYDYGRDLPTFTPGIKYNETGFVGSGGGKKFSLKHIQKGGRLAAKRTRKSINEFLNSSVTSSYIYGMVQNNMTKNGGKRKSKRKRGNENKRSLKRTRR